MPGQHYLGQQVLGATETTSGVGLSLVLEWDDKAAAGRQLGIRWTRRRAARPFNDIGTELLEMIPFMMRRDPDITGVVGGVSEELDKIDQARYQLLDEVFIQSATELGMPIFESMLGLSSDPSEDMTTRRDRVVAWFRRIRGTAGKEWAQRASELLGHDIDYQTNDPADLTSPPVHTVRIDMPQELGSLAADNARDLLRAITPANMALQTAQRTGFILDSSELDQQPLF